MWVTSPLSAHSQPCLASLVDVTVSPTGMRERGRKHKTSIHSYNGFHLEGPHLHTYTQYLLPNAYTHAQQVTTSSHRRQAKPKECNCYCIVNPLNSHSPGRSPSFSNSFYSLPPKILPQSLLAGPALFSWSSWTRLTKPSLLPISSETGAGTMIASLLAERGRGKRGPWELQADTLRVVQVSSSPGPVEKRRLICCRCFPREGGCRREEVVGVGAVRGGRARKTRRCRGWVWRGVSSSFQNRPPKISLVFTFFCQCVAPSLLFLLSQLSLLHLFSRKKHLKAENNSKSWHHDCKMFQLGFSLPL